MKIILKTIKKRISLLFIVQVLTLLTLFLLVIIQYTISPKAGTYELSFIIQLRFVKICAIFIASIILFKIFDQIQRRKKTILFWAIVIIPLIFVHALLIDIIQNTILLIFDIKDVKIIGEYLLYLGITNFVTLLLFSGLYFAVRYWENTQLQKEKTLESEALAHEAQLQMLRYQINPHFLFNSLNTIRATIFLDQEKARHIVTLLSDFFRYTLEKDQEKANTIGKEVEAIQNYLDIQKIRFEEKIDFSFNIDPKTQNIEIPFFIIHPLVENAVKYGIETSSVPLIISVKSTISENNLIVEVSNSGSLITKKDFTGDSTNTGIENINKRLDLVYPENYEFSLSELNNKVVAKLVIKNIVK
jgi:two-component system, LytTR family, sensor kinase